MSTETKVEKIMAIVEKYKGGNLPAEYVKAYIESMMASEKTGK